MLNKYLFVFLIFLFSINSCDASLNKEKMQSNLDILKNTFEVYYAPYQWKKSYANWDLDEKIAEAKELVDAIEPITIKDYHRILKTFFNSTRDYHVGIYFYSTEEAFLPFRIHGSQGRYFIAWVYKPLFSGLKDPLCVGDEVVLFDGAPVHDLVQSIKDSDYGNSESLTDQALAESDLTMRVGEEGYVVPKGPVTLTVRHAGTKEVTTYRLHWFYHPEYITDPVNPLEVAKKANLLNETVGQYHLVNGNRYPLGKHPFFAKEMVTPKYKKYKAACKRRLKAFQADRAEDEDEKFIGDTKSFVPALGEKVWTADKSNPFEAYIYLSPEGKQIGYVRIPHYGGGNYSADKFSQLISKFDAEADAVVIDQLNNPGGNVFYMYALASMLSPTPLEVPSYEMAITQEDLFFALEGEDDLIDVRSDEDACEVIGSNLWGYPVDITLARQILYYFRFIIDEWEAGRRLTRPEYVYGVKHLALHPKVQLSKPLLVLTNSLDFSCGDFLPAILQDNGRATILGTRTAGAGGYVLSHEYPNLFGILDYSFTGSLAKRSDKTPVENLGVSPDIEVELTPRDLEFDYVDYVESIHKGVRNILFFSKEEKNVRD